MRIYVEVEENPNSFGVPLRAFSAKAEPYQVALLKIDTPAGRSVPHRITGWSSQEGGSPCPAYCVPVEDSGAAVSYLVYGGDWGVRMMPAHLREPWDPSSPNQTGEPYLLLADESDLTPAPAA